MRISNREITHDSRLDSKFALSIKFKKKTACKKLWKTVYQLVRVYRVRDCLIEHTQTWLDTN